MTGKYVDENTFAGSQYFDLSGKEFPDQFQLEIYIYKVKYFHMVTMEIFNPDTGQQRRCYHVRSK